MSSPIPSNRWVAIVDDDESIRRALRRLLCAHGMNVEAFDSGEDYLARATSTPACICLDVHFNNGMNGYELSKRLEARGDPPPIIFISAHPPDLSAASRAAHHRASLAKPLDVNVLLDLVTECVAPDRADNVA